MSAIDNAVSNLAEDGIIGVADFFTSAKYDLPNRQHSYIQRWFWRSVFDVDGIGKALSLSPCLISSTDVPWSLCTLWHHCCGDFSLIS
jgi:hypothetical protein